jgi:hypothetical protein
VLLTGSRFWSLLLICLVGLGNINALLLLGRYGLDGPLATVLGIIVTSCLMVAAAVKFSRQPDPATSRREELRRLFPVRDEPEPVDIALPHRDAVLVAVASGLGAIAVGVVGLTMTLNERVLGPIMSYTAALLFGELSLSIGSIAYAQKAKALTSLRLQWHLFQDIYREASVLPNNLRNYIRKSVRLERDALVKSGDLRDAYRAAEVLFYLDEGRERQPGKTGK